MTAPNDEPQPEDAPPSPSSSPPALTARRRLEQAHELWHGALAAYPEADHFCTEVNALIPSLRSVTFVLQKELRHIDGFDAWYEHSQERMRDDDVMRWLVDARNFIEKQGDLELRSTARVSVVASWLPAPYSEFDVPPLLPPHAIAARISCDELREKLREEGVIRVERRWVTASLPDSELLDACAYGWAMLNTVLSEAEKTFDRPRSDGVPEPPARLACMVAGPDARSALLHLATGEFLEFESHRSPPSEEQMRAAEAQYGELFKGLERPGDSLTERVRSHHELGRRFLKKDGHHAFLVFPFRAGRQLEIIHIEPADQQEKYVLLGIVGQKALAAGADEVIMTSETWVAR